MKEIKTEVIINATADKVWDVLTNFDDYPYWNPFLKCLKGKAILGNKIRVRIAPPNSNAMTFMPKVLKYEKNKEFRWLGHLFTPGLFDGEHIFELTDNGDGTTTFVQREQFNGILVPLFKKMLDVSTPQGFEQMNKALKDRVENHLPIMQVNKKGRLFASLMI